MIPTKYTLTIHPPERTVYSLYHFELVDMQLQGLKRLSSFIQDWKFIFKFKKLPNAAHEIKPKKLILGMIIKVKAILQIIELMINILK